MMNPLSSSSLRSWLLCTAALFLTLSLAACGSGSSSQMGAFPFVRMAPMAPPENMPETPIRPNNPMNEIWRDGYWNYDGFGFKWVPGEVIARPDMTAIWSPDRWELRDYGWTFVPGYWQ